MTCDHKPIYNALILAAGCGRRLFGDAENAKPKCLLSTGWGGTILSEWVGFLSSLHCQIRIVTGFKHYLLEGVPGVHELVYNDEWFCSNTALSMGLGLLHSVDDGIPIITINGDIMATPTAFEEIRGALAAASDHNIIFSIDGGVDDEAVRVVPDWDQTAMRIGKKITPSLTNPQEAIGVNLWQQNMANLFLEGLTINDNKCYYEDVVDRLILDKKLRARVVRLSGSGITEIDTEDDLFRALKMSMDRQK